MRSKSLMAYTLALFAGIFAVGVQLAGQVRSRPAEGDAVEQQAAEPAAPQDPRSTRGRRGRATAAPNSDPANPESPESLALQDQELEAQIQNALLEFANADSDQARTRSRESLLYLLDRQFALRQQVRENEIAETEQRVRQLRETLKKRADARQTIIDRREAVLLSDIEGLGWGDPTGQQPARAVAGFGGGGFGGGGFMVDPRGGAGIDVQRMAEMQRLALEQQVQLQQQQQMANAYARAMGSRPDAIPAAAVAQLQRDFELEAKVAPAVQTFAAADSDEARAQARKALREILDEQFSTRQEIRLREIAELDGRVRQMRDALNKRAALRKPIVERRLNELTSDSEGLGWGEVGGGSPRAAVSALGRRAARGATPARAAGRAAQVPERVVRDSDRGADQGSGRLDDAAFARFDKDKDGSISADEWKSSLLDRSKFEQAGIALSPRQFPMSRAEFQRLYLQLGDN